MANQPEIPEPYNIHAFLEQPDAVGSGANLTRKAHLQFLEAEWAWYRMGGPGAGRILVEGTVSNADTAVEEEWDLVLEIRLEGETEYSTWYRGVVRSVERKVTGGKTVSEIKTSGYWNLFANRVVVEADNVTGTSTVKDLLGTVMTTNLTTQGRIVWDAAEVAASAYTPTSFEMCGAAGRTALTLLELQGSREFYVHPSTRKFTVVAESSTVAERSIFIVGKNAKRTVDCGSFERGGNRYKLWGHPRGGKTQIVERADATAETADGTKAVNMFLPEFSSSTDLNQWADNQLSSTKDKDDWTIIELDYVRARVEGSGELSGVSEFGSNRKAGPLSSRSSNSRR